MTDLISRQAIEDLIMETDPWWCEGMTRAIFEGVKQLPTIDPVKHGKWIKDKYTRKCSECESTYWMREGNEWNYCPNCGSKNGGEG